MTTIESLTEERDHWASEAMKWRRKYAELRHPGMTREVKAAGSRKTETLTLRVAVECAGCGSMATPDGPCQGQKTRWPYVCVAHRIGRACQRCQDNGWVTLPNGNTVVCCEDVAFLPVRAGYRLVPLEPTPEMLKGMAAVDGWSQVDPDRPTLQRWRDYWHAALSAEAAG